MWEMPQCLGLLTSCLLLKVWIDRATTSGDSTDSGAKWPQVRKEEKYIGNQQKSFFPTPLLRTIPVKGIWLQEQETWP